MDTRRRGRRSIRKGHRTSHGLHPSVEGCRSVLHHVPTGIGLVDLNGGFLAANPCLCEMFGYSVAEFTQKRLRDVNHPDDDGRSGWHYQSLLEQPCERVEFESRYVDRQGHVIWGATAVQLMRKLDGAPECFVVHIQDNTRNKTAENTLRENEEKFRIAFENAPTGMSIIRPDGQYLAVNPMLCRMFGYSKEELLAGTINRITHPEDVERGNRWIRKMIAGDTSEPEFEKRYIHKDGPIVWGSVRAGWLRDENGAPRVSVVHIQDITERKRAEEALRTSERQLREAHDIAQMGHWQLVHAAGSMQWAPGIYRIFETTPDACPPSYSSFLSFVHPEDRATFEAAFASSLESRSPCDITHRLLLPGGRLKHVRAICRSEYHASGKAIHTSGILQDVTSVRQAEEDRVRLEAQFHRAQKMEAIGYLAGGIAHDFNNLLTAMGGNAALALRELLPTSPLHSLLTEISAAVDSAAELTRQLLTFSRKQVITPRVLDLNQLVAHRKRMLTRLLGEDLELVAALAENLGHVRADSGQLEQILVNLAINARDAMPHAGKLVLETADVELDDAYCRTHNHVEPGDYVMLAVSDNGAGMSEETKSHLFEPFYTTKEQGRGTGLGLAMVYGAVKQNNGHIEVYSELGHGTTIKIYLPRVNTPADEMPAKEPLPCVGGTETIILVEDEGAVRSVAERMLSDQGYRVHSYANASEALAALQAMQDAVHLLITDVVMPGMNGRVLADHVKVLRPGVEVLFTSGYAQDLISHHGLLEKGIEFLAKPYSLDSLARRVRQLLDRGFENVMPTP